MTRFAIADEAVLHFLATVLDKSQFEFFNLEVSGRGFEGYVVDRSHTLYCEFGIPAASLRGLTVGFQGPITVATDQLESVVGPASTHFPEGRSTLNLDLLPDGLGVEYVVTKTVRRTKRIPDVPSERQRRLTFDELAEAAEAVPSDPKFLALAGSTLDDGETVRVSIADGELRFGPSNEDQLALTVASKGKASTRIMDRIFRVINKYIQSKDPPRTTFTIVDDGVLAFEARYESGPWARYLVTRAVEND